MFRRSIYLLAISGAAISFSGTSAMRSEEHTSELQSPCNLVCRLLLEKKNKTLLETTVFNSRPTLLRTITHFLRILPIIFNDPAKPGSPVRAAQSDKSLARHFKITEAN